MKLQFGFLLFTLQLGATLADRRSSRHANLARKRQVPALVASAATTTSGSTTTGAASTTTGVSSASSSTISVSSTQSTSSTPSIPIQSVFTTAPASVPGMPIFSSVSLTSTPSPAVPGIPPLSQITSGMPSQSTDTVTATYTPGAQAPISGAPALPTSFVFNVADWPTQDRVPDTSSQEVQTWMMELNGFDIPNIPPTVDGSCAGDPVAAAQAKSRGWWTCGGWTRVTDITACPDKLTWGVSFDDGPSPYTQTLLNYMSTKNLQATFFIVGSRVIERPQVLLEEYMSGNEISVHTWSHRPLTSLTNAQIVAELGWTRKAIKHVLGVTPTTMRPPFGDIDDRVRAISMAMGLTPIIWTRTPSGGVFDTNDWRVGAGQVTGLQSYATFQTILNNATSLDTGFIVLQHDLFQITVDLAVGYTLNSALTNNPQLTLKPIGQCMKIPSTNLYMESTTNRTFPYANHTYDIDGTGSLSVIKVTGNSGFTTSAPTTSILILVGLSALISLL